MNLLKSQSGQEAPNPRTGFESKVISEIRRLFYELPAGAAQLRITRVPNHPEYTEPYFELVPSNPKSATFKGVAVLSDLNLTVGHSWREFYGFSRGGTIVRGATWEQELTWIWRAVVAGCLTERLYFNSRGDVIGWFSTLIVNDERVIFRNGRRYERIFAKRRTALATYEPFFNV